MCVVFHSRLSNLPHRAYEGCSSLSSKEDVICSMRADLSLNETSNITFFTSIEFEFIIQCSLISFTKVIQKQSCPTWFSI